MTELSPQRVDRITGSRVAAILGLDPYRGRDDVMRDLVRQHHGAESEFTGNVATDWGIEHEEEARAAYEHVTGNLVFAAQEFVAHPDIGWLGISPDGLVGDDGLVEIKCPYRASYTSISERPGYAAQVQLQLECTNRAWCDFVIYRPGQEPIIERVGADPLWLPSVLDELSDFYQEYSNIVADPELAAPYLEPLERADEAWRVAAKEYHAADEAVRAATERLDAAKAVLRELAGDVSVRGCGVSVSRSERAGSVDYKAALAAFAPAADLDAYRKPGSVVWAVRAVQDKVS